MDDETERPKASRWPVLRRTPDGDLVEVYSDRPERRPEGVPVAPLAPHPDDRARDLEQRVNRVLRGRR